MGKVHILSSLELWAPTWKGNLTLSCRVSSPPFTSPIAQPKDGDSADGLGGWPSDGGGRERKARNLHDCPPNGLGHWLSGLRGLGSLFVIGHFLDIREMYEKRFD